jgi:uracil-DNA glycosylase
MERSLLLAEIAKKVEVCQRCDLWKGTSHAVPGEGNPEAKVVFIGEAPGFYEDRDGRPFVGAAGKLLDKMLLLIGLSRKEVFIANVVKHRPPENRDPLPAEISACKIWLDQQLEVINPRLVVTLGRYSLARYLANARISGVHGQVIRAGKQLVLPMYHPAAALRAGSMMEAFKGDFLKNKEVLLNPEKAITGSQNLDDEPQLDLFS